jgi:type IV secretion system protein VirB8
MKITSLFKPKTQPDAPASEARAASLSPNRLPQTFAQAAAEFERSRIEELIKTRKIAIMAAIIAFAFAGICIVGIVMSFALHREPQPVVLRVDNGTGNVEVLTSIKNASNTYDEVVNRYWLAQFVKTCERYDWYSLSVDYDTCKLYSTSDVFNAYSAKVQAKNSPLETLKDKGKIDVRIVSVSFLDEHTAHVRFTSQKLNQSGENTDGSPLQRWIATVVFDYDASLMTDQQRMMNPLGFRVHSYQVDAEAIGRQ